MTLRAQNERIKSSVFCIEYIETNGQFMPQELFPFVFLAQEY